MTKRLLLLAATALAAAGPAHAGPGMFVGAAEDASRSHNLSVAMAKMELAKLAGFDAIRLTSNWRPGLTRPSPIELLALRNAGTAAQLHGIRLILSVYHPGSKTTPRTRRARAAFASYVSTIARQVPAISDFIIGNEPNLNLFWMPQFTKKGGNAAAASYLQLLATSYDALKRVSPDINVIGGSVSPRGSDKYPSKRHTHSPTTFIRDLGIAYRKSKRKKPVMDAFAFHPYLIPSRLPPTFKHPRSTTIGLSDYGKLVKLLGKAFDGTRQPGSTLPIVYDEFGYQSEIPAAKQSLYTNLSRPPARDAISEALQAAYYRKALAIALCQPTVTGLLLFHVTDEPDALRWQSGVYYADDTPKTSLETVRDSALAAREGSLSPCAPKPVNPVQSIEFPVDERALPDHAKWNVQVQCDQPCRYVARLESVTAVAEHAERSDAAAAPATTEVLLRATGAAPAGFAHTVSFPSEPLALGRYQYVVRVWAVGKPGTAVVRISEPFLVAEPEPLPPCPVPEPAPDPSVSETPPPASEAAAAPPPAAAVPCVPPELQPPVEPPPAPPEAPAP